MIPLSVLDLAPVPEGSDVGQALRDSIELARRAERWGYRRFWLAEHHGMPGVASAATAVVIGQVAAATSTIRVGAGGIMLPNHAPLAIAEQFGTLEALFPGRIDLGVGRAPGTDQATARALRRTLAGGVDRFPHDVAELIRYFEPSGPEQAVRAVPGEGLRVPVWILGSSLYGAELAATQGLPFAFASHFAPGDLGDALHIYREYFEPSDRLAKPYVMLGLNLVAAESDEEARRLFTSTEQQFLALRAGRPGRLPPPVDDMAERYAAAGVDLTRNGPLARAVVGSPDRIRAGLQAFVARYRPDEVIVTTAVHDFEKRARSYEILAEAAATMPDLV